MSPSLHKYDKPDTTDTRSRRRHRPTSPIAIPPRLDTDMLRWIHGIKDDPKDDLVTSTTSAPFTYVILRPGSSEKILDLRSKDVEKILSNHNRHGGCKYYGKFYTGNNSYIIIEGRAEDSLAKAILDLDFVVGCTLESPWPYDDGGEPRPYKEFASRKVKVEVKMDQ